MTDTERQIETLFEKVGSHEVKIAVQEERTRAIVKSFAEFKIQQEQTRRDLVAGQSAMLEEIKESNGRMGETIKAYDKDLKRIKKESDIVHGQHDAQYKANSMAIQAVQLDRAENKGFFKGVNWYRVVVVSFFGLVLTAFATISAISCWPK